MPKKAADKIITHRIELGNFERKEAKETLDELQKLAKTANRVAMVPSIILPVAAVGGALAIFFGSGMIAKALGYAGDLVESVKDPIKDLVYGQSSYDDGGGPANTRFRDEDGNLKNPYADDAVIGGLFGLGMKFGSWGARTTKSWMGDDLYEGDPFVPEKVQDQPFRDYDDEKLDFAEKNYPTTYAIFMTITDPNSQYNVNTNRAAARLYILREYRLLLAEQFNPNTPPVMGEIGALNDLYFNFYNIQLPAMPTSHPPPPMPPTPLNPSYGPRQYAEDYQRWLESIPVAGLDGGFTYTG